MYKNWQAREVAEAFAYLKTAFNNTTSQNYTSFPPYNSLLLAYVSDSRPTSIGKMQSDTTFHIYIAERCFYIACLNNYMFRPLYRPSSGCTLPYYKANCTINNVFVLSTRSCLQLKNLQFKTITVAVELKNVF
jgi:hypothetical protein